MVVPSLLKAGAGNGMPCYYRLQPCDRNVPECRLDTSQYGESDIGNSSALASQILEEQIEAFSLSWILTCSSHCFDQKGPRNSEKFGH